MVHEKLIPDSKFVAAVEQLLATNGLSRKFFPNLKEKHFQRIWKVFDNHTKLMPSHIYRMRCIIKTNAELSLLLSQAPEVLVPAENIVHVFEPEPVIHSEQNSICSNVVEKVKLQAESSKESKIDVKYADAENSPCHRENHTPSSQFEPELDREPEASSDKTSAVKCNNTRTLGLKVNPDLGTSTYTSKLRTNLEAVLKNPKPKKLASTNSKCLKLIHSEPRLQGIVVDNNNKVEERPKRFNQCETKKNELESVDNDSETGVKDSQITNNDVVLKSVYSELALSIAKIDVEENSNEYCNKIFQEFENLHDLNDITNVEHIAQKISDESPFFRVNPIFHLINIRRTICTNTLPNHTFNPNNISYENQLHNNWENMNAKVANVDVTTHTNLAFLLSPFDLANITTNENDPSQHYPLPKLENKILDISKDFSQASQMDYDYENQKGETENLQMVEDLNDYKFSPSKSRNPTEASKSFCSDDDNASTIFGEDSFIDPPYVPPIKRKVSASERPSKRPKLITTHSDTMTQADDYHIKESKNDKRAQCEQVTTKEDDLDMNAIMEKTKSFNAKRTVTVLNRNPKELEELKKKLRIKSYFYLIAECVKQLSIEEIKKTIYLTLRDLQVSCRVSIRDVNPTKRYIKMTGHCLQVQTEPEELRHTRLFQIIITFANNEDEIFASSQQIMFKDTLNKEYKVYIFSNSEIEPYHEKLALRQFRGAEKRKAVAKELETTSAMDLVNKWFPESNETMSMGNPDSKVQKIGHDVARKVKSEVHLQGRLHLCPLLHLIHEKMMEKPGERYIRHVNEYPDYFNDKFNVTQDEMEVYLMHDMVIDFLKECIKRREFYAMHYDASGKFWENKRKGCFFNEHKNKRHANQRILVYAGAIRVKKITLPIFINVTSMHSYTSQFKFLYSMKDIFQQHSLETLPITIFVVDWAWASINALNDVFNNCDLLEYLNRAFKEETVVIPIAICVAHVFKRFTDRIKKKTPPVSTEQKRFMFSILAGIIKAKSKELLFLIVKEALIITSIQYECQAVTNAWNNLEKLINIGTNSKLPLKKLLEKLHDAGVFINERRLDNIKNDEFLEEDSNDENDEILLDDNRQVKNLYKPEKRIKNDILYYRQYLQVKGEVDKKSNEANEKLRPLGKHTNSYYDPRGILAEVFDKKIPYAPLFSMVFYHKFVEKRQSNAVIECLFRYWRGLGLLKNQGEVNGKDFVDRTRQQIIDKVRALNDKKGYEAVYGKKRKPMNKNSESKKKHVFTYLDAKLTTPEATLERKDINEFSESMTIKKFKGTRLLKTPEQNIELTEDPFDKLSQKETWNKPSRVKTPTTLHKNAFNMKIEKPKTKAANDISPKLDKNEANQFSEVLPNIEAFLATDTLPKSVNKSQSLLKISDKLHDSSFSGVKNQKVTDVNEVIALGKIELVSKTLSDKLTQLEAIIEEPECRNLRYDGPGISVFWDNVAQNNYPLDLFSCTNLVKNKDYYNGQSIALQREGRYLSDPEDNYLIKNDLLILANVDEQIVDSIVNFTISALVETCTFKSSFHFFNTKKVSTIFSFNIQHYDAELIEDFDKRALRSSKIRVFVLPILYMNHFRLFIVDIKKKEYYYFNSTAPHYNTSNQMEAKSLLHLFIEKIALYTTYNISKRSWVLQNPLYVGQSDATSCGPLVIEYFNRWITTINKTGLDNIDFSLFFGKNPTEKKWHNPHDVQDMTKLRINILKLIRSYGLIGDQSRFCPICTNVVSQTFELFNKCYTCKKLVHSECFAEEKKCGVFKDQTDAVRYICNKCSNLFQTPKQV